MFGGACTSNSDRTRAGPPPRAARTVEKAHRRAPLCVVDDFPFDLAHGTGHTAGAAPAVRSQLSEDKKKHRLIWRLAHARNASTRAPT